MTQKLENNQEKMGNARQQSPNQVYRALIDKARQTKNRRALYQQALGIIAGQFSCPYATLYIQRASDVLEEYWHSGSTSPDFWKKSAREFLNETLSRRTSGLKMYAHRESSDNSIAFLSCPVYNDDSAMIGAIVLVIYCKDRQQAIQQSIALEAYTLFMSYISGLTDHNPNQTGFLQDTQTLARAAGYTSGKELGFAITNNLRNRIGCDQISLGIVHKRKVNIVSISGHDTIKKGSKEIDRINEAMLECLDTQAFCLFHHVRHGSKYTMTNDLRLHRQWHTATGNSAVASIPLRGADGRCQAVLSLRRGADLPFDETELSKIREITEPLIGAYHLVDRANRSLFMHGFSSIYHQIDKLKTIRGLVNVFVIVALLALVNWFLFASLPYRITVPARAVPAQIRHFATPAEARLDEVLVKEGDRVKQGDILCRFSNDMLQLQRSELLAEYNIARLETQKAVANGSTTDIELARANSDYLLSRLDILDQRIGRLIIKAPYDGQVIKGDPARQTGQILPLGAPLFELAPSGQWLIELNIPEQAMDDILVNMSGTFSAGARPEEAYGLTIRHLSPTVALSNKKNIYIVRAESDLNPEWIRSGMEGVARVEAGRRPVWWIALHKVIEYVQMHFWY